jgi:DNA-binding SARP family transcriptional activator
MDSLSIRTLGHAEVNLGGQPVQWRAESARTLFFYLLTFPGGRSRTEIINALWDAEPDALLSNRFRVVVHRARAALGAKDRLLEEHNRYRLSAEVLSSSDVQAFSAELEQTRRDALPAKKTLALEHLLHTYQGDYLPLETADWAQQGREEHRAVYVQAQLELSELQCEAGACSSSVESLAQALRADPYMGENHHQRLMTCLSVVEDKYAATEHFRRFVSFLHREVNDSPMPETLQLAERIKGGEHICQRHAQGDGAPGAHYCPFSADQPCHIMLNTVLPNLGTVALPALS